MPEIRERGAQVAFVHMSQPDRAKEFFASFGIGDVLQVSDPERTIYSAFKLGRGKLLQLAGVKTVIGAARAFKAGHRQGSPEGDVAQMPGAFLIERGRVVRAFYHQSPADRPDYLAMAVLPEEVRR